MAVMTPLNETAYAKLVQVFMAFAQGAGPHLLSGDAILQLTTDYRSAAEDEGAEWNTIALIVLGWARALGSLSAHRALHENRVLISRGDYASARESIARHPDELMGRCPWTRMEGV